MIPPLMKFMPIPLAAWSLLVSVWAEDGTPVPSEPGEQVSIPGPIADGSPAPPGPLPEVPEFQVAGSSTRCLEVVEAPPIPGIPPVAGTMSVTVRKVVDPKLPDAPSPLPALSPEDPQVQARMAALGESHQGHELIFVSGETYDHARSLIRIYPQGRAEGSATCWSNLDLAHFSGFAGFRVTQADGAMKDFGLLMGHSEIDTAAARALAQRRGQAYREPEIPELPDRELAGPAFVLVGEETEENAEAVEAIRRMHELYQREGTRMAAAHAQRVANQEARKAVLLANPPKPKDLMLHYWRGKRPENVSREGGER